MSETVNGEYCGSATMARHVEDVESVNGVDP